MAFSRETLTKITLDTEHDDVGADFASNKLTIGEDGKYVIYGQVTSDNPSANKWMAVYIYKNGAAFAESDVSSPGASSLDLTGSLQTLEDCSAGDYFELYFNNNFGNDANVLAGSRQTYMSWFKLIE